MQQQNKHTAAAQPLVGIKHHTPKQFSAKLYLQKTCQTSHQRAALGAEGGKTEHQKHEVCAVGMSFLCFFPPLVLLIDLSKGKKSCFTKEIVRHK